MAQDSLKRLSRAAGVSRLVAQVRRVAKDRHVARDDAVVKLFSDLVSRISQGQRPPLDYPAVVAQALNTAHNPATGELGRDVAVREAVVNQFHRLYYHSANTTWKKTTFGGVTVWKCPLDLWLYQEMLAELRPDLIVETGTAYGGSALYLASMCDVLGRGHVVTIDILEHAGRPRHPRITYLTGSSTDADIVARVEQMVPPHARVLVILDSDHTRRHVLAELTTWQPFVDVGSYLVVEDSNINGHPAHPRFGPGPMEAVQEFLHLTDDFVVDAGKHKFLLTFNPGGYLRRVGADGMRPAAGDQR